MNGNVNVVISSFVLTCMLIIIHNFKTKEMQHAWPITHVGTLPTDLPNKPHRTGVSSGSPLTHCADLTAARTQRTLTDRGPAGSCQRAGTGPESLDHQNPACCPAERSLTQGRGNSGKTSHWTSTCPPLTSWVTWIN